MDNREHRTDRTLHMLTVEDEPSASQLQGGLVVSEILPSRTVSLILRYTPQTGTGSCRIIVGQMTRFSMLRFVRAPRGIPDHLDLKPRGLGLG